MTRSKIQSLCKWIWPAILLTAVATSLVTRNRWLPAVVNWIQATIVMFRAETDSSPGYGHSQGTAANDDHETHAGHGDTTSLELSDQAMRNIGLTEQFIRPIQLEVFRKTIKVLVSCFLQLWIVKRLDEMITIHSL